MLKRVMLSMILVALLVISTGCQKETDTKVEIHEEVNVEETIDQRMVVE